MSDIAAFSNLPDVSFIDFLTLEQIQESLKEDYINEHKRLTGEDVTLTAADPAYLSILSFSLQLYQAMQYVDRAGKQDLLKYSYGEYLDNLAARLGLTRKPAGAASVLMRFNLSATQRNTIGIPSGTRVCTGDGVYFATAEYAEIAPAGFATTSLTFTASGANEGLDIPAGTRAATAEGITFKTDAVVRAPRCAAATSLLLFTLKTPRTDDYTVPAGTIVKAADGFAFVTDYDAEILASTPATTTLRFYPPSTGTAVVPAGTTCTSANGKAFTTDEDVELDGTDEYIEVAATAKTPGAAANGIAIGTAWNCGVPGVTVRSAATSAGGEDSTTTEASATATVVGTTGNAYGIGALTVLPTALAQLLTVTNTEAASGGTGSLTITAAASASTAGEAANGCAPGTIKTLLDPIEGIVSVTNTTASVGGYGRSYTDVRAVAEVTGTGANDYPPGTVNVLVDPISYIGSVANVTETSGGTDEETDDALTERVFLAPQGYSVAGPRGAYEYIAKQFRSDIGDVCIVSPDACKVSVYVLLEDGSLPTANDLAELLAYLSADEVRPLTDQVSCLAPTEQGYTINLTYYIASSDSSQATAIQQAVNEAVEAYAAWQRHIGADINPTELIYRIRAAGAKRVVVTAPVFTVVPSTSVPKLTSSAVNYGGVEDD